MGIAKNKTNGLMAKKPTRLSLPTLRSVRKLIQHQSRRSTQPSQKKIGLGLLFVLAVLIGLAIAPLRSAQAVTSNTLNFQARLMTATGGIVPDGNYHIEFKIYNAASSSGSSQGSCAGDAACQWTETRTTGNLVQVKNGYLTVNLGSVTALPNIDYSQQLWLTMRVGGSGGSAAWDPEMNPRLQLTAVPYAFKAGDSATLGGIASSGFIQNTVSPQAASFNITGSGTIGSGATAGYGKLTIIGTGSSNASLYVAGTSTALGYTPSTGTAAVFASDPSSATSYTNLSISAGATSGQAILNLGSYASQGKAGILYDNSTTNLGLFNNSVLAQTIDATGKVGIGTNPGYKLDVSGDINASGVFRVSGSSGATTTCSGGQFLQNAVVAGGIVTGGTCAAASGSGVTSVGAISGTSNANGATITGSVLNLTPADATNGGVVSNGTQTFAGAKTFNGALTLASTVNTNTFTANTLTFGDASNPANINAGAGQALNLTGNAASSISTTTGSLSLSAATTQSILIGTTNSNTVTIGTTSATSTITVGRSTGTNTISIGSGNTSNTNTQTINIGAGTPTGTGNAQIGIGNGNGASAVAITAAGGGITLATNSSATGTLVKSLTNSTTAFQVQNAAGTPVVSADTVNQKLSLQSLVDTGSLGSNLFTAGSCTGTNWSGTGPWTHTAGSTASLSCTPPATVTPGTIYQVEFTVASSGGSVFVSIGGNATNQFVSNSTETQMFVASSSANLTFVPGSGFVGSISSITVKVLTPSGPTLVINNNNGTPALELRSGGSGSYATAVGVNALRSNTTGTDNTATGYDALRSNTTGIQNTASGSSALVRSTTGSNNAALGYAALALNTSGSNNTAVGSQSLLNSVSASFNTALGYQSGQSNIYGSNNTYIGSGAGNADSDGFTTPNNGTNATAIGYNAQAQTNNSLVLGGAGSNAVKVGIGTTMPGNTLSVSPVQYGAGAAAGNGTTASQSGTTVTGTGTTFTSAMVGSQLVFANGTAATITARNSNTSLTVTPSQTVSSQAYRIHYPGLQVTSSGNIGVGTLAPTANLQVNTATNTTTAFQVQDASANPVFNVDTTNAAVNANNIDTFAGTGAGAALPISGINRVNDYTPGVASYGTGSFTASQSFTPKANTVLVAYIYASENCTSNAFTAGTGAPLTISGGSLTWVSIGGAASPNNGTNCDIGVRAYYAVVGGSPPSGMQVTVDAGSFDIFAYNVVVDEYTNVNTSTPIAGFANANRSSNNNDTWTLALGATPSTGDVKVGLLGIAEDPGAGGAAILTPSGWTQTSHIFQSIYSVESQALAQTNSTSTTLNYAIGSSIQYTNNETAYMGFILKQTTATGPPPAVLNVGAANATQINISAPTTFKASSNSLNAFQIQNTAGVALFNVDTTNSVIKMGGSLQVSTVVDSRSVTGASTITESTPAQAYYLSSSSSNTNTSFTTTFNITGLQEVDGTIAYIFNRAEKADTTNARVHTQVTLINGEYLSTTATPSVTGVSNSIENYMVMRIGGEWRIVGINATNSDTADLAEWIHYTGEEPQPGELLTVGDDSSAASVKKTAANDQMIIGAVTTDPAQTFSNNDDGHSVRLALTGRIPIKVSLENGPIQPGDYLTTSSIPGVAMKATTAGRMVGVALTAYSGGGDGTVMTQVQPGYAVPVAAAGAGANGLQGAGSQQAGADGSSSAQAGADTTAVNDRIDALTGQVTAIQGNVSDLESVYNNFGTQLNTLDLRTHSLTVSGDASILGALQVGGVTSLHDLQLDGHFVSGGAAPKIELQPAAGASVTTETATAASATITGTDTAGTITVVAGSDPGADALVKLIFNKPFADTPQVVITPIGKDSARLNPYIDSPSASDFLLGVNNAPEALHTYRYTYHVIQ